MSFLIDTNVLSEVRKGGRAHPSVAAWWDAVADDGLFVSAITIGEIRFGIERVRTRDIAQALRLERWLKQLRRHFASRLLPVTTEIAELWGGLSTGQPLPVKDGLIAATALHHGLTVVTRNIADFERAGVPILDPFVDD